MAGLIGRRIVDAYYQGLEMKAISMVSIAPSKMPCGWIMSLDYPDVEICDFGGDTEIFNIAELEFTGHRIDIRKTDLAEAYKNCKFDRKVFVRLAGAAKDSRPLGYISDLSIESAYFQVTLLAEDNVGDYGPNALELAYVAYTELECDPSDEDAPEGVEETAASTPAISITKASLDQTIFNLLETHGEISPVDVAARYITYLTDLVHAYMNGHDGLSRRNFDSTTRGPLFGLFSEEDF